MKKLLMGTVAALSLMGAGAAQAELLDFEDPDTAQFDYFGPSYHGLTFTNWAVVDRNGYGASGYSNAVVSGDQSACGCASDFGQTITSISSLSGLTLDSGYFASAWNDGATLLVQGFSGASLLFSTDFVVDTTGPLFNTFGWSGIDRVEFSISGGTQTSLPGEGDYFAVDDLSVSAAAVPEPATWAMMIAGFVLAGSAMRRRRAAVAAL